MLLVDLILVLLHTKLQAQIPRSVCGTKDATQDVTNAVLTASGDLHKQGITEAEWTEGKSEGNTLVIVLGRHQQP